MAPFLVAFDRVVSFGRGHGRRPLVLWGGDGLFGLFALHRAIHAALSDAGIVNPAEPPFEPHLTLLRDQCVVRETFIPPVCWTVREFVLIDSLQGQGEHVSLGCWPLAA